VTSTGTATENKNAIDQSMMLLFTLEIFGIAVIDDALKSQLGQQNTERETSFLWFIRSQFEY
jgi:hypothetical protein